MEKTESGIMENNKLESGNRSERKDEAILRSICRKNGTTMYYLGIDFRHFFKNGYLRMQSQVFRIINSIVKNFEGERLVLTEDELAKYFFYADYNSSKLPYHIKQACYYFKESVADITYMESILAQIYNNMNTVRNIYLDFNSFSQSKEFDDRKFVKEYRYFIEKYNALFAFFCFFNYGNSNFGHFNRNRLDYSKQKKLKKGGYSYDRFNCANNDKNTMNIREANKNLSETEHIAIDEKKNVCEMSELSTVDMEESLL